MKKLLTKIKVGLAGLRITLISFSSKVLGDIIETFGDSPQNPGYGQRLYGVPSPIEEMPTKPTTTLMDTIIKITPRLVIAITFIIGIVSFIKIRKFDDETLKKKKIKNTIIIISILIILIIISLLLPRFLKKYL